MALCHSSPVRSRPMSTRFCFSSRILPPLSKSDEDRESELLHYLQLDAFDFFYKAFVKNGDISADESD